MPFSACPLTQLSSPNPCPATAPLPQNLVYLDVMNNSLTGPIPDVSEVPQLTLIDLSQNKLDGNMPASFGAAADSLVYMDMSQNKLGGNINPGTLWERVPQLQYLFMQQNSLEGKQLSTGSMQLHGCGVGGGGCLSDTAAGLLSGLPGLLCA